MPAPWTIKNPACTSTWAFLRAMKQLTVDFKDAGVLTMKDLTYWNPLASPDARRTEAQGLASQLDPEYLSLGSKYEAGYNRTKAVNAMTDALVTEKTTVADFAVVVDAAYRFVDEGTE